MGIENFKKNLRQKEEQEAEKARIAKEKQEKLESEDKAYLDRFASIYKEDVVEVFKKIRAGLKGEFNVEFDHTVQPLQYSSLHGNLNLTSVKERRIAKINISIIGEGPRRLITIASTPYDKSGNEVKKEIGIFQDTVEKFLELNLEDKISEFLSAYYG
jgi:hypothetical protein